jgi:hypothetical protein
MENKQLYCGNIEVITIIETYHIFVNIDFASEGQIIQVLTDM